jgi:hypothetical protein
MPVSRLREAALAASLLVSCFGGRRQVGKDHAQNNGFVTAGKLSAKFPAMRPLR